MRRAAIPPWKLARPSTSPSRSPRRSCSRPPAACWPTPRPGREYEAAVTVDNGNPFSDFLDDYFAECDDHLMGVRRLLLTLESSVGRSEINRSALDELFRHFHSLKGISGMVELRAAEDLAHSLEEYLRALRQREAMLTAHGVDALFDGAQVLEQVIGARRDGAQPPSIEPVVARVRRVLVDAAADRAAATPALADV